MNFNFGRNRKLFSKTGSSCISQLYKDYKCMFLQSLQVGTRMYSSCSISSSFITPCLLDIKGSIMCTNVLIFLIQNSRNGFCDNFFIFLTKMGQGLEVDVGKVEIELRTDDTNKLFS
jgi:hypothetical protein